MQAETTEVRWTRPAFDVYEGEGDWMLVADLPGVKADQLEVTLDGHELVIEARAGEHGFRRAFKLPEGAEDVDAKLENGTLTLKVARPARRQPRRIAVQ